MELQQLNSPLSTEIKEEQTYAQPDPQAHGYKQEEPDEEPEKEDISLRTWAQNTSGCGKFLFFTSIIAGLISIIGTIIHRKLWYSKLYADDLLVNGSSFPDLILAPYYLAFLAAFLYTFGLIVASCCSECECRIYKLFFVIAGLVMIVMSILGFVLASKTNQKDESIKNILLKGECSYCQSLLFFSELNEDEEDNQKVEIMKALFKSASSYTDYKFKDGEWCQDQTKTNIVLSLISLIQVLFMIFAGCQ